MRFTIDFGFISDKHRLKNNNEFKKIDDRSTTLYEDDMIFSNYLDAQKYAESYAESHKTIKYKNFLGNIVEGKLSANSAGSGIVSLEIVSHRVEKPTEKLFSFNDVKELLLHGNDSYNNSLVIDENGKLLLIKFRIVKDAFYAVRHETFAANNRYVGNKNISDDFIRSVYISMLDGWESHLHSHQSVYVDLHITADEESLIKNISELIEKI
ncbi:hypothetical protein [Sporosarcina sp. FSL K6-3457]|uniref:hypothetical protein n=1 Tax=Sporosarcina sp. FSL K6-3457 TaxID=2978204 RepID=UPI0030F57763